MYAWHHRVCSSLVAIGAAPTTTGGRQQQQAGDPAGAATRCLPLAWQGRLNFTLTRRTGGPRTEDPPSLKHRTGRGRPPIRTAAQLCISQAFKTSTEVWNSAERWLKSKVARPTRCGDANPPAARQRSNCAARGCTRCCLFPKEAKFRASGFTSAAELFSSSSHSSSSETGTDGQCPVASYPLHHLLRLSRSSSVIQPSTNGSNTSAFRPPLCSIPVTSQCASLHCGFGLRSKSRGWQYSTALLQPALWRCYKRPPPPPPAPRPELLPPPRPVSPSSPSENCCSSCCRAARASLRRSYCRCSCRASSHLLQRAGMQPASMHRVE